jgi:hypothetical protein
MAIPINIPAINLKGFSLRICNNSVIQIEMNILCLISEERKLIAPENSIRVHTPKSRYRKQRLLNF